MVKKPSSEVDIRFRRVSIKGIQDIYNSLNVSDHVVVGYILKILPYMNDCNILCYNPISADVEDVDIMTDMDFCNEVGLSTDKSNVRKFMKKVYCIGEGASNMPLLQKLYCDIYKKDILFINMFVVGFAHSEGNQDIVMNWLSGVKFCNYNDTEPALSKAFQEYMKGKKLNVDNANNPAPIDGLTAIANQ